MGLSHQGYVKERVKPKDFFAKYIAFVNGRILPLNEAQYLTIFRVCCHLELQTSFESKDTAFIFKYSLYNTLKAHQFFSLTEFVC